QHSFRQAEGRDLASHETAALFLLIIQVKLIAQRSEVARYRKRSGAGADDRYFFTVWFERTFRHELLHIAFVVGGHALEAADGNGFFFHTASAAGRLARPVACSS